MIVIVIGVDLSECRLYGSYELLKGGSSSEAMEDFTGGITEVIDLKGDNRKNADSKNKLFQIMQQSQSKMCLMGCSIEANPKVTEAKLRNGLIMGHAYSVTAVKQVQKLGKLLAYIYLPVILVYCMS